MSYLERARICNQFNLENYRPFRVGEQAYGWVRNDFAQILQEWPTVFSVDRQQISLAKDLTAYQQRSDAVHEVMSELHRRQVIDTWVGEPYPVTRDFDSDPVMEIERSAILYFGLLGFGIHMNGLVQTDDGVHVWVGTRSRDKPFYSGKLDQMVAGGQPLRISIEDNLLKECREEANIPPELAGNAQPRGSLRYMMETERGLDVSMIFLYDLWLPEDFEPENTDGEVESFALIPLGELARLTDETDLFKDNCNLVNIELLIRSGLITQAHTDFDELSRLIYGDAR
ncbi:MAG: DUF4743 domain-containing protein [Gammaproteobacteria bacterium]|nr:DUF4743 domain-containing protein [Gammaproteobacteria bacterium]